jgi:hypothetical protein
METFAARRIEILVDRPLVPLLERAAERVGVSNWAVIDVLAGRDGARRWSEEQLMTGADDRRLFLTVLAPDKAQALIDALAPLLDSHGLLLMMDTIEVVRGGRF